MRRQLQPKRCFQWHIYFEGGSLDHDIFLWATNGSAPLGLPFLDTPLVVAMAPGDITAPLECRTAAKGFDYKGRQSKTVSGRTCQAWEAREVCEAKLVATILCK